MTQISLTLWRTGFRYLIAEGGRAANPQMRSQAAREPYTSATLVQALDPQNKLWMSLILLLSEGILEDFQVLRHTEKFVCIFSCMQTGKAVIQRHTSACDYGTALWFPILWAGSVLKDQTRAWGHIKDFCSQRSCPPETRGKENAAGTLCL